MDENTKKIEAMNFCIQYIMNTGGLYGIEEAVRNNSLFKNVPGFTAPLNSEPAKVEPIVEKEEPSNERMNDKIYDYVEKSGMYEQHALHDVAAEFGNNIKKSISNIEEKEQQDIEVRAEQTEEHSSAYARVLTPTVNAHNNFPDARRVEPGELNN